MARELYPAVVIAITADAVDAGGALNTAMFTEVGTSGVMAWEVVSDEDTYFIMYYTGAIVNGVTMRVRDNATDGKLVDVRYELGQYEVTQAKDLLAVILTVVDRLFNEIP